MYFCPLTAMLEYLPAAQAIHSVAPAADHAPSMQFVHPVEPSEEYLPAAQIGGDVGVLVGVDVVGYLLGAA